MNRGAWVVQYGIACFRAAASLPDDGSWRTLLRHTSSERAGTPGALLDPLLR